MEIWLFQALAKVGMNIALTLWEDSILKGYPDNDPVNDGMIGKQVKLLSTVMNSRKHSWQSVPREVARVKKDGFILEHGLYPKFTETFKKRLDKNVLLLQRYKCCQVC